jgi:hypothetical protein
VPGRTTLVNHSDGKLAAAALQTARVAASIGRGEGELSALLLAGAQRRAREAGGSAAAAHRRWCRSFDFVVEHVEGPLPEGMTPTPENVLYLRDLARLHGHDAPRLVLDAILECKQGSGVDALTALRFEKVELSPGTAILPLTVERLPGSTAVAADCRTLRIEAA